MPLFALFQNWEELGKALLAMVAFGMIGIVLLVVGFKAFEMVTPKVNLEAELAKGNVAVGISVGALLVAISFIIMHAMN